MTDDDQKKTEIEVRISDQSMTCPGDEGYDELVARAELLEAVGDRILKGIVTEEGPITPERELDRRVYALLIAHELGVYARLDTDSEVMSEKMCSEDANSARSAAAAVIRGVFSPNQKEIN